MSVTVDLMNANTKGADSVKIRDYGDRALLLEFEGTDEVLAWSAGIRAGELSGRGCAGYNSPHGGRSPRARARAR